MWSPTPIGRSDLYKTFGDSLIVHQVELLAAIQRLLDIGRREISRAELFKQLEPEMVSS